jgi:hypothetical protein
LLAATLIFAATYLTLAVGRIPYLRVDRTGAAIIGASLMLAFNVLTVEEAYAAITYDTIILLFGMMIVVADLRLPRIRPRRRAADRSQPGGRCLDVKLAACPHSSRGPESGSSIPEFNNLTAA